LSDDAEPLSGDAEETPRRRRLYLDTSAYLCILLAEEGWERLSKETDGAQLLSSVILILEARRNLIRLARARTLDPEQYKICIERVERDTNHFVLRDLTLDLCQSNLMPAVATPRSLDLVHLRSALWFHAAECVDRFVTMDGAQEQAARELGLPV
jgi:predicted nucleic acid-binding protein